MKNFMKKDRDIYLKCKKSERKKRKGSINRQYTLVFGLLLAGTITILCTTNALVLKDYYTYHKKKALMQAYIEIDRHTKNEDILSDDFSKQLMRVSSMNNIEIVIMNQDLKVVLSTSPNSKGLTSRMTDFLFLGQKDAETLFSNENYQIVRSEDDRLNLEFIELWGVLSNGYLISARSPVESIRESAVLADELMIGVGAVGIAIGVLIVLFATRRITKPIMELVSISEKMTHLDFGAKYNSGGHNEIDLLGEHINQLSGALESTISDLKSANTELQNDIDKKNKLEEKRKEFISNVSHELKTPIALIQGYAEGLKDCVNDDDESRDFYCDVIMDEAQKMNKLVRNLLELDQLENGNEKQKVDHFNIKDVIFGCAAEYEMLCKQDDITLELPDDSPLYVWADEFKLEQVVNNYLSNAIHYAKGEKKIIITAAKTNDIVRVSVFNTGDCIPEESLEQIWNKFYKVDKARTREYGGSGIGLSIVKAIMESTGQAYGVVNKDNGVEFWFEVDAQSDIDSL